MGFYGILIISAIALSIVTSSSILGIQNSNILVVNGFNTYRSISRIETFENIINYIHTSAGIRNWSDTIQMAYPYSYQYNVSISNFKSGFILSSGEDPKVYYLG